MKFANILYSKPLFYMLNFIFFFIKLVYDFFYFIFVLPFKGLYNFITFMIQVNIFFRIEKKLRSAFELDIKKIPCEYVYNCNEIKEMLRSFNYFSTKNNKPTLTGEASGLDYHYKYEYRDIELNVAKKERFYVITLFLNNRKLIDVKRAIRGRQRSATLFL